MDQFVTGDIIVNSVLVASSRGVLDLTSSFVSCSIFESIFTPGVICYIEVLDTVDFIKSLQILGDEIVIFEYKSPGSVDARFLFHLNSIKNAENVGAQKAKMYSLQCVSKEILHSKTNIIQKSYVSLCSDMILDIHTNYLKSSKDLVDIEKTAGAQKIIIPSYNPFKAINTIKKRSISAENKSSVYVYFETRESGKSVYKFVTLEKLYQANTVKRFQQSDAISTNILELADNNILSYKIPNQISAVEKIRYGGPRLISQFNFTTQQTNNDIVDTTSKDPKMSQTFIREFFSDVINPPQSVVPVDISQRPTTNIPENVPNIESYIASLLQNSMKIQVPGDTLLTVGQTIDCLVPSKTGLDNVELDSEMSGKFLISRIHHKIGNLTDKPRYTCVLECLKVNYRG